MHSEENRCFQALTEKGQFRVLQGNVQHRQVSLMEGPSWCGILQSIWAAAKAGGRPKVSDYSEFMSEEIRPLNNLLTCHES